PIASLGFAVKGKQPGVCTLDPAYEIENLWKRYPGGVIASSGLNFTVACGEIFGVLGPNGAGKSTLVRQMVGLTRPTSGTVRLFGTTVHPHDLHLRRNVSFLAQSPLALLDLTIAEAVAYTGMLRGLSSATAWRQAQRARRGDRHRGPLRPRDRSTSRVGSTASQV
ncbi:ABC transporter ATP-binding protein, partial [mine drainage metagenome]